MNNAFSGFDFSRSVDDGARDDSTAFENPNDAASSDAELTDNDQLDDDDCCEDEEDIPEFGLVDVIEAFTAMRHEWRNQTREGRELSEAVVASTQQIRELEQRLAAHLAVATSDDLSSNLVNLIIDIDTHLSRAVDACQKHDAARQRQQAETVAAVRDTFARSNFMVRWFSRGIQEQVLHILNGGDHLTPEPQPDASTEGLLLVVSRLQRLMAERRITRVPTVGQPFDGETMNAVSAVESKQHSAGHVVEELSPGYFWRGQRLKFADVRVSK
ncbi:MAG: nucleotide exchange factor GrpE [Planctomycetaceae bacterium]